MEATTFICEFCGLKIEKLLVSNHFNNCDSYKRCLLLFDNKDKIVHVTPLVKRLENPSDIEKALEVYLNKKKAESSRIKKNRATARSRTLKVKLDSAVASCTVLPDKGLTAEPLNSQVSVCSNLVAETNERRLVASTYQGCFDRYRAILNGERLPAPKPIQHHQHITSPMMFRPSTIEQTYMQQPQFRVLPHPPRVPTMTDNQQKGIKILTPVEINNGLNNNNMVRKTYLKN